MSIYNCVRAPATVWLFVKEFVGFLFFLWTLSLVLRFFLTVDEYFPWFMILLDGRFWTPAFLYVGWAILAIFVVCSVIFLVWCLCCYLTKEGFNFAAACFQCFGAAAGRYSGDKPGKFERKEDMAPLLDKGNSGSNSNSNGEAAIKEV